MMPRAVGEKLVLTRVTKLWWVLLMVARAMLWPQGSNTAIMAEGLHGNNRVVLSFDETNDRITKEQRKPRASEPSPRQPYFRHHHSSGEGKGDSGTTDVQAHDTSSQAPARGRCWRIAAS